MSASLISTLKEKNLLFQNNRAGKLISFVINNWETHIDVDKDEEAREKTAAAAVTVMGGADVGLGCTGPIEID